MTDIMAGTQRWDYAPAYDHARYMRLWRLKRRGGRPLLDPRGRVWGYAAGTRLYTTEGRRWA